MAQGPLRSSALANGWKQLEMPLRKGDGTVIIKVRREHDGVAVSVGFSEPRLQALAATHARQLQDALQAQYNAAVDFSLMDGGALTDGSGDHTDGQAADSSPARRTSSQGATSGRAPLDDSPAPPRSAGRIARREWIG